MIKRLGRELKKVGILVIGIAIVILAIWILSKAGGILPYLAKNWKPCGVGAIVALIGKALVDAFLGEEEEEE